MTNKPEKKHTLIVFEDNEKARELFMSEGAHYIHILDETEWEFVRPAIEQAVDEANS